jgi:hypothetical protein
MELRYKLTDQNMQTHNGFQWELNTWKKAEGKGTELCSEDFLYCYTDPLLAEILNPIYADYINPRLFKCNVKGEHKEDSGLKEGWKEMNLIEEMPLPEVSLTQRTAFGILCAKEVCKDSEWNGWADSWLSGKDRSKEAARAALESATPAAVRAARAALESTTPAAWAAAWAAWTAGATTEKPLDLIAIAKEAMNY